MRDMHGTHTTLTRRTALCILSSSTTSVVEQFTQMEQQMQVGADLNGVAEVSMTSMHNRVEKLGTEGDCLLTNLLVYRGMFGNSRFGLTRGVCLQCCSWLRRSKRGQIRSCTT